MISSAAHDHRLRSIDIPESPDVCRCGASLVQSGGDGASTKQTFNELPAIVVDVGVDEVDFDSVAADHNDDDDDDDRDLHDDDEDRGDDEDDDEELPRQRLDVGSSELERILPSNNACQFNSFAAVAGAVSSNGHLNCSSLQYV